MSEFVTLSAGLLLALSIPMLSWVDVSGGGTVVAGQGPLALGPCSSSSLSGHRFKSMTRILFSVCLPMYVLINYVIICSYYKLRLDGHTIIVDEIFNKNIYI